MSHVSGLKQQHYAKSADNQHDRKVNRLSRKYGSRINEQKKKGRLYNPNGQVIVSKEISKFKEEEITNDLLIWIVASYSVD